MLVWGAATGLAGIPAEMAAQSGPGQPRGRLGTWMAEARASAFQASIQADPMANPAPGHAARPEARTPAWMSAGTDSMASQGRIFRNTLLAAFIPMVPGMIMGATASDSPAEDYGQKMAAFGVSLLGAGVTLVSVPVTAIKTANARVDKGPLVLGVAAASVFGGLASLLAAGASGELALVAPVYSLIMAAVATASITHQFDGRTEVAHRSNRHRDHRRTPYGAVPRDEGNAVHASSVPWTYDMRLIRSPIWSP